MKPTRHCRVCDLDKPKEAFRGESRVCMDCREHAPPTNMLHAEHDPFRYGVDIKGLDRFLRKLVITVPGEHRVK